MLIMRPSGYDTPPMSPSLTPGSHFGAATRATSVGQLILTETRFAPGLRTPWHSHQSAAICLVLAGRYRQRFRDYEVDYLPASVLYRPAGVDHADRISDEGARCFIIEPPAAWLSRAGLGALSSRAARRVSGNGVRWLMQQAHAELQEPDASTPMVVEGLVLAIGGQLARVANHGGRDIPRWLDRVRQTLDAANDARLTLDDLAAVAEVHPTYLATTFRRVYGMTVGEYQRRRRVERAAHALGDPDRTINEIALSHGFSSQSHFTQVFKRETGFTPKAYRARKMSP